MKKLRAWPHLAIIALIFFVIGGVAVVLWSRYQPSTEAAALPNAARLERVSGEVGLSRALNESGDAQWISADQNTPLSVGDRIYTKDNANASIAFTGRNFARLDSDTSLDVLTLSDEKTQVALRDGSSVFEVGSLNSGDLFEVATPCGAQSILLNRVFIKSKSTTAEMPPPRCSVEVPRCWARVALAESPGANP